MRRLCNGILALLTPALIPYAFGQANFAESFDNVGVVQPGDDGPSGLIQQGWIFRNQSAPKGTGTWDAGLVQYFPPHTGAGFLCVDSLSTDYFGGDISQWAILPAVPNQSSSDRLTFYLRRLDSSNQDTFQVRYSPSGGTSTGSGVNDVGDFTVLLADLNPIPLTGWTLVSLPLPGSGRLALRYYVNDACNFACFGSYVGIDELTVNPAPPPGPPLPGPGQTVHWTPAISPVVISKDATIVAGGKVIVDAGVQVQVNDIATLYVLGTVRFEAGSALSVSSTANVHVQGVGEFIGTPAAPVTLTGGTGGIFAKGVQATQGGTVRLDYVNSDVPVYVAFDELVYGDTTNTIRIDHSAFSGDGDVRSRRGTLAIRNSVFNGPTIEAQESYVLLDASTLNGSMLTTDRRKAGQPVYLNDLVAQNVTLDSPFQLRGFDYFFGPNNLISNNLYPVHLVGGGVASGSTLPTSGNINNYVHGGIGEFVGVCTLADAGLPYRIDFDPSVPEVGGWLTIEPGVTVKFSQDAELFVYVAGRIIAEARPEKPIVFEPLTPGVPWWGLAYDLATTRPKLEHCILRGAEGGLIASRCFVRTDSVRIEDNARGARVGGSGVLVARKCEFRGNGVGVETSPGAPPGFLSGTADLVGTTNPNWFEGNGVALDVQDPLNIKGIAPNNWWAHPTGPQHPTNPGGQGQLVTGWATVTPFLTSPPNFADHPPMVRMIEPYFLMEEDAQVIVHWSAEDDGQIVKQQILYSPHGENPPLAILIDNIPPGQRSIELTVPQCPPSSNNQPPVLRVVAIDNAGQEGWDEAIFATPYVDFVGTVFPEPISGEYRPGETIDVCYTFGGGMGGTVDVFLFLDADGQSVSLGGGTTLTPCLPLGLTMPPVSTDTARVGTRFIYGAGGRVQWEFTDYFAIRPDPLIGDAPPSVTLLSPSAGQSFPGGGIVPIAWSAVDDEGVRSITLQASYDAGRTWHVIADNLPGASSSFNWKLPPIKSGIADVRVRVIARDVRFQNTSHGANVAFSITPGAGIPGDINGDGKVDQQDLGILLASYGLCQGQPGFIPAADIDQDGCVGQSDLGILLANWTA